MLRSKQSSQTTGKGYTESTTITTYTWQRRFIFLLKIMDTLFQNQINDSACKLNVGTVLTAPSVLLSSNYISYFGDAIIVQFNGEELLTKVSQLLG